MKAKVIDAVQKFQPILLRRYQEFLTEAGAAANHPIDSRGLSDEICVGDLPGFHDIINHPIDSRGSNEDICIEDLPGFNDIDWASFDLDAIWEQPIQAPPTLQPSSAT